MSDRVRIGVVGAGLIGRRHIERIAEVTAAELVGIADPAAAGRELAAKAGVPHFETLAALVEEARPDGLVIATPNAMHVENGLAAIAAGLPALIEKPIADDLRGAQALVDASQAAGVPVLVGHHRRHNPIVRAARAEIEAGRLGRIVAAHGTFWLMKPDDYFDVAWRRSAGAGPALVNMIHDVDLLRFLCGEIEEIFAYASNAVRGNPVEESCAIAMKFAGGALGTFALSDTVVAPWSWEMTAGENPAYPPTGELCLTIGGARGSLSIPRLDLWSYEGAKSWFAPIGVARVVAPPEEDALRLQARQLARVARGLEPPLVSGRDGLATLRVVDAISRAAREGGRVAVGD